jgi:hypothetical protein
MIEVIKWQKLKELIKELDKNLITRNLEVREEELLKDGSNYLFKVINRKLFKLLIIKLIIIKVNDFILMAL